MRNAPQYAFAVATVLAALTIAAPRLSAQESTIPTAQASAFMGSWTMPVEAQGTIDMGIEITDNAGQVAAAVTAQGETSQIQKVSRNGEALVLEYDYQGMDVAITLTPSGETLAGVVEVDDGMFTVEGTASRD